jgi:hypothetical protein
MVKIACSPDVSAACVVVSFTESSLLRRVVPK